MNTGNCNKQPDIAFIVAKSDKIHFTISFNKNYITMRKSGIITVNKNFLLLKLSRIFVSK